MLQRVAPKVRREEKCCRDVSGASTQLSPCFLPGQGRCVGCYWISLAHIIIYLKPEVLAVSDGKLTVQYAVTKLIQHLGKTRRAWYIPTAHTILSCVGPEFFCKEFTFLTTQIHDIEKGKKTVCKYIHS